MRTHPRNETKDIVRMPDKLTTGPQPWLRVLEQRMRQNGVRQIVWEGTTSRVMPKVPHMSDLFKNGAQRATRAQIIDFYERLLSESYEDWHGLKDRADEADHLEMINKQLSDLIDLQRREIADLKQTSWKRGASIIALSERLAFPPPELTMGDILNAE